MAAGDPRFRYFFAFRPNAGLAARLAALAVAAGQDRRRVRTDRLHLTLCVIGETLVRDPFLAARARAALTGAGLASFPIGLGRIGGGPGGAAARAIGWRDGIQGFYRALVRRIAGHGLAPIYRMSGLRPHVTLGYDPCAFEPFTIRHEWFPDELLLIESELGRTIHNVVCRWPLSPPLQGLLQFDDGASPTSAAVVAARAWSRAGSRRS